MSICTEAKALRVEQVNKSMHIRSFSPLLETWYQTAHRASAGIQKHSKNLKNTQKHTKIVFQHEYNCTSLLRLADARFDPQGLRVPTIQMQQLLAILQR
jgi:hypothetical protein